MPYFSSESINIAYEVYGEGAPVVLVHGFASNGHVNWVATGWVEALVKAGYQAITIDNRGHGASEKLYDSALYPARKMAVDVINLIDHLGVQRAALMGYSMGARISAFAVLSAPERLCCAVFGGLGINMVHGLSDSSDIVSALLAPTLGEVTHKTGRQFRIFAEHTQSDLKALAACMASSRDPIGKEDIAKISMPVLVAVGSEDAVGGRPEPLAGLMPNGDALVIEGRDHMRSTGDPQFKAGVLDFFSRVY